jgi:hypothetical protein
VVRNLKDGATGTLAFNGTSKTIATQINWKIQREFPPSYLFLALVKIEQATYWYAFFTTFKSVLY